MTGKQKRFIEAYLSNGFNATQAAKSAGYAGDDVVLASVGYENLRKPQILEVLDRRMSEMTMSANEVLYRLTEEARGNLTTFIGLEEDELKEHPQSFLLKKHKHKITRRIRGEVVIEVETREIELYDAQTAKVQLGRYHKLFVDRVQQDDWRSRAIDDIKAGRIDYQALAEAFDVDLATQLFRAAGVPVPVGESAAEK